MVLTTPVVLIIFNRPSLTETVFKAIAKAKPQKLLVIADGPRYPEEAEQCEKSRAVIERVNWNCEVITNYSKQNLGCGRRIASGLEWVFSEVEDAIILEDDCLPAPSFFYFCQALLQHYRHDERIMHISGHNFQYDHKRSNYSYYFSKHPHIWGWASWRRAWKYYDHNMETWPEFKETKMIESVCEDPYEQKYWMKIFDRMFENAPASETWDYQWTYACWSQNGLSILPSANLISNIGCGRPDATHTFMDSRGAQLPTNDIWEVRHPQFVIRHRDADAYTFDYLYGGKDIKMRNSKLGKFAVAMGKVILPSKVRHWMRIQVQRLMWQYSSARAKNKITTTTNQQP